MDKNTLSNYGWIVIAVLVLAVMMALATPFGSYIKSGVESTTQGLFDTSENALNVVGMSAGDGSFESGTSAPEYDHNAPELHPSGTIPEGATYKDNSTGETLSAGDNFPTPQSLDYYKYGDYGYTYVPESSGWKVKALDNTKSEYGSILESINGKPVKLLYYTFSNCSNIIISPVVPNSITSMSSTFVGCSSLTTAPEIPDSVTSMNNTFQYCTNLTGVIVVNANLTSSISNCFMLKSSGKNIILTGSCTKLQELANTSTTGYRTVYDIDGNILKQ